MRNIDRFILHVVHNWKNELNEAYSENAIKDFINKFKEEADDLNVSITDDQLRQYIKAFDRIKEKLPSDQRDLNKWSISKFIKFVTTTKSEETEKIDITPDVVYHNEDNSIVIYNGSKEANCIKYGKGESWCITRSSFPNYRYSSSRSYPTFYLAKNNNLSDSDKLSFVAIQVRQTTRESERYVYTDRTNSPYESRPMDFNTLLSNIPWLRDIPNIQSILKYIPITSAEELTQQYRSKATTYKEWTNFPFSTKQQYLVVRKNYTFFQDISNDEFVEKYLPKYPEIAKFVAETPNVVDPITLLKHLDKFSNQARKSITANIQEKINLEYLPTNVLPFDVKKLLVQLDKWNLDNTERLYVNKEGDTIVKLKLGDNVQVGLFQEDDNFPDIKLNKRTAKYLTEYPELDKIPLNLLVKLSENEIIDKSLVTKIIEDAKKDPNSALIVKDNIILDSNSFASYKMEDGGLKSIPFNDEEVQKIFIDSKDNESLQKNAVDLFKNTTIPGSVDKNALISIINATSYNQRKIDTPSRTGAEATSPAIILTTGDGDGFFLMPPTINPREPRLIGAYEGNNWRTRSFSYGLTSAQWRSYFAYLRATNQSYSDDDLIRVLGNTGATISGPSKKDFIANNPPINTGNRYKPAVNGDTALLINTANPLDSYKISNQSGKLVKANVPISLARQLLGGQPAAGQIAAQVGGVARRGRPAGAVANVRAPRPQQPAVGGGNINVGERIQNAGLTNGFLSLPRSIRNRLNVTNARASAVITNRGASRRQNLLGNAGRVTAVLEIGPSAIYFIQLNNGTTVASIVAQPGNTHYIVTPQSAIPLGSPAQLLQALQQRNLAEVYNYITNEYFDRNPNHLSEFRQLLRQHINEKKKQNENK